MPCPACERRSSDDTARAHNAECQTGYPQTNGHHVRRHSVAVCGNGRLICLVCHYRRREHIIGLVGAVDAVDLVCAVGDGSLERYRTVGQLYQTVTQFYRAVCQLGCAVLDLTCAVCQLCCAACLACRCLPPAVSTVSQLGAPLCAEKLHWSV